MALSSVREPAILSGQGRDLPVLTHQAGWRRWLERLSRLGLVIRGLIYFVPGVFALKWALGSHRQPMTQASTIDLISHQPWGRALLVLVAIGLAGYTIWGVLRATLDPLRRGHSPMGIALRFGYLTSAIAYLGLLVATIRVFAGSLAHVEQHQDWTVGMLAHPYGRAALAVIGLCWIFGAGLMQVVMGWRRTFEKDLMIERMSLTERRWATGLGRVGLISRGIVFIIIGVMLVAAALHPGARTDMGLEGALTQLAHQPFGRTLLGSAGLGLMTFGFYSAMCARWTRMHRAGGETRKPSSHPVPL
jgi:hypothetical protein